MQTSWPFLIGESNTLLVWVALGGGALLALWLGGWRWHRIGGKPAPILVFSCLAPLLAAFFAHLGYCLARFDYVVNEKSIGYFFAFWQPGHMLYGGAMGCLVAAALCAKAFRQETGKLLDAYAPSAALMAAAIRLAEGLGGQGYGEYLLEEGGFCRFPFAMLDPYYEMWAWSLFLLEILWALVLLVVLLRVPGRRKSGDLSFLLLGLYAAAQIVFESLRRDDFLRWGFVRCSEVFSVIALFTVLLAYHIRSGKGNGVGKSFCWLTYGLMITMCLLLEFATEGRVPFLTFLDANGCYIAMAFCCAVLAGCVLWMRRYEPAGLPQGKAAKA